MEETKISPRKWWWAGLCSFIVPGLGQLYNGQLRKGLALYLLPFIIGTMALILLLKYPSKEVFILVFGAYFIFWIYVILDAAIYAYRNGKTYVPQTKYPVIVVYIFVALLFALGSGYKLYLKSNIIQAFKIPSGSMIPTLEIGDHILADKTTSTLKNPVRGDLMVFEYPVDPTKTFVKRVVGVPGDVVEVRNKQLYVNNNPVNENYIIHADNEVLDARDNFGPVTVPQDSYFFMGDNRDRAHDSRFWGFVRKNQLKGKVRMIYWSWDRENKKVRWERVGEIK